MEHPPELLEQLSCAYRYARRGVRIDGVPFDPSAYPFLIELYDDPAGQVVVRKCSQVGLTSWAILTVIDRMVTGLYPRGVLYLFPTDDEVYDFSQSRFDRLLRDNQSTLGAVVMGTDRTTLRKIGPAYLYFRGTRTRSKLLSIPVDAIVYDEYDEMDANMVKLAEQRVSGSRVKHLIKIGHPTVPGFGIDGEFERSDQRLWMIKCKACGEYTCLEAEFPDSMVQFEGKWIRGCRKCKREVAIADGEWVAKHPTRDVRGYWISQLLSPTVSPTEIMRRYEHLCETGRDIGNAGPEVFWAQCMGQAYADVDDALSEEDVLRLCSKDHPAELRSEGPTFLGCDVGKQDLHVMIGAKFADGMKRAIRCERVSSFDELLDLGRNFNVQVGVLDEMAETRAVMEFKARASWAWGCVYVDGHSRHETEWDYKQRRVRVHRTASLDASHQDLVQKRLALHRQNEELRTHVAPAIANLVRTVETQPHTGERRTRWIVRGIKRDHYRHALNYMVVAGERCGILLREARARGYISEEEDWQRPRGWQAW